MEDARHLLHKDSQQEMLEMHTVPNETFGATIISMHDEGVFGWSYFPMKVK